MAAETPDIAPKIVDIAEETVEEIVEETLEPINEEVESAETVEKGGTIEQFLPEAKRKPGRPSGSRNKGPSKPRKKVVSEPVVAPSRAPSPPRWDAQHQPIPTQATTEMAELMLRLLSNQSMERQRRKDAQRRAWFS
jgi:hypothetical protein